MKKYKNIIFDVGDVLLDYRWKEMLVDDYGLDEKTAEIVGNEMFDDPLWHEMDLWNMTEEEIICGFEKKYPEHGAYIRWFITHGEGMKVSRPKVWEKLRLLKKQGYGIYLLSNYPESLFVKHTKDADFMKDIDGAVVSYMIHKTKPDREIYEYLLEQYQLKAEESLFFDDRKENVEGAIACGIDSRQVFSQESLLEYMDAILNGGFEIE
ncbi:HAD family phosphatase [Roseburia sp. MUC/MUC-530-WT-4D]|uniref:HAD family phosphatase n=1 Tax=Roseburia porci TaxID=2605790 RepID=A0A6L5YSQ9_9FIRM|nr:HAD family phosphatase [Roseburia porci]MDD6742614.1 HAD family phosphatase [Roseburia porci]MST74711.1 HAD family phosphatase [Roseburia porci]